MLKLINAGPSPFGRKVMVALYEKGIAFATEWDIPWHNDTVVAAYNPLEQLPILICEDGEIVYESSYIIEWIDTRFPEPPLTPDSAEARLAMGKFRVLAVGVMDALVRVNFELSRPEAQQSDQWVDRHVRKINGGLRELNRLIGESNFAVDDTLSLADIEIGCVLGQLDFIGENVAPLRAVFEEQLSWRKNCPQLARYTDQLMERPSFKRSEPFMVNIDFASVTANSKRAD